LLLVTAFVSFVADGVCLRARELVLLPDSFFFILSGSSSAIRLFLTLLCCRSVRCHRRRRRPGPGWFVPHRQYLPAPRSSPHPIERPHSRRAPHTECSASARSFRPRSSRVGPLLSLSSCAGLGPSIQSRRVYPSAILSRSNGTVPPDPKIDCWPSRSRPSVRTAIDRRETRSDTVHSQSCIQVSEVCSPGTTARPRVYQQLYLVDRISSRCD
jgi:hypothetical protein